MLNINSTIVLYSIELYSAFNIPDFVGNVYTFALNSLD